MKCSITEYQSSTDFSLIELFTASEHYASSEVCLLKQQ